MNGYQRDGVSEAGAPMYKSKWNKPPIGVALARASTMFVALLYIGSAVSQWHNFHRPLRHTLFSQATDRSFMIAGNLATVLVFASYCWSGIWMLKTRYRMRQLQTTDQICTRFGMGDDVFHAWREEQTIKPHININGTDYYCPADFVDAGTLLRASAQPVTSETLLRPTESVEQETGEQLLRAKA